MLNEEWQKFISQLSVIEPYLWSGSQAIYPQIDWSFDADILLNDESMQIEDIGFTPTKITHLTRHYYNEDTIARAVHDLDHRIDTRKYGSGVWDFRGEEKKTTKQDYCLTAGVIAYYPQKKHTRITINYRTVELIFRFRADLIFLRDIILPKFPLDRCRPDTITFRFVNCTLHPMFYVLFLLECKDPVLILRRIRQHNPRLHKEVIRWTDIHLSGRYKSYATAARVQKFIDNHVPELRVKKLRRIIGRHS